MSVETEKRQTVKEGELKAIDVASLSTTLILFCRNMLGPSWSIFCVNQELPRVGC